MTQIKNTYFQSYKDLFVWKKGMELFREVTRLVVLLPSEGRWSLGMQMTRASISIPSNIAEGYNAGSTKQWIKYLHIAFASACELETQLLMIGDAYPALSHMIDSCSYTLHPIQKMLKTMLKNNSQKRFSQNHSLKKFSPQ